MSGTRGRAIRGHVVAAIREVPLDQRAGEADRFQHLDTARRPDACRERSFRVYFSVLPHRDDTDTGGAFVAELTIELYYPLGNATEDRASDDAERFWWGLETLADLSNELRDAGVMISDPAWLGVEVTERLYIPKVSLVVRYRLDDTLIA